MSQQTVEKPSLSGVKIKARKGAVKAHAKHEPNVFRDQLYKHLETVAEGDFDGYYNKLVQAGSTLEFLKYADALFEIILAGGLLQPGGSHVQDGAPPPPFSILQAKEPAEIDDLKKYVDVLNKLIRRYKYLQKPLEETSLPSLLQYVTRWKPEHQSKFAITVGLMMAQGLVTASCLQNLAKEQVVKNDGALNVVTVIFRAYLVDQSVDQLGSSLRKGGIKDLMIFLPANKRQPKIVDEHFKKEGLPLVAEYFNKRQLVQAKETTVKAVRDMCSDDEHSNEEIVEILKASLEKQSLPETDFVAWIWQGLMSVMDWNVKPDQLKPALVKTVEKYASVLEPFCENGKSQVALINAVQLYYHGEQRATKFFQDTLRVLYNKDCLSSQAIVYWHQKGSKPQSREQFLQSTDALVKYLQQQEEESDEEEEE